MRYNRTTPTAIPEIMLPLPERLSGSLVVAEIWDTLKAVTSDLNNPSNTLILESAGIIVHGNDLRTSYDERGQSNISRHMGVDVGQPMTWQWTIIGFWHLLLF